MENRETIIARVEEDTVFDLEHRRFKEVVTYNGVTYDLRELLINGNAWYRMTSESRVEKPEPSYIEVNQNGHVIREVN